MVSLPSVFSSGALLQGSSIFDLQGFASPGSAVTAVLARRGGGLRRYETSANENGRFKLTLEAPKSSFDIYDLTITDFDSEKMIDNILFGELWIASGQSNMEMTNVFMRDREKLYQRMKGKNIRIYAQVWLDGLTPDGMFPYEEKQDLPGRWISADDPSAALDNVSACASAAILKLYELFAKNGENIPVGFLNVSVGGTTIETWLPRESVMDGGEIEQYISKIGRLPTKEKFNTYKEANFTQPCALFNLKIAPLTGIRARGTLWYQGESNVASRESGSFYLAALRAYQIAYQARFAPDGETYQMICSQLYPWLYNQDECTFGYLNLAFTDAADAEPDKFGAVTVYDLPPVWAFGKLNHPIHPSNKYQIGERMGRAAYNRCRAGRGLRTAVTMQSYTVKRGKITVRFNSDKRPLKCTEQMPRGFYIADESGLYVEAEAQIHGSSVVLFHPHIKKPLHAAYMVSCLEMSGRVYCGGLPIAPFMTNRESPVHIEPKPWKRTEEDSIFVVAHVDPVDFRKIDAYPRPTWVPSPGTQICRDRVFSRRTGALRIIADENGFAEVNALAYIANRMDMYNYSGFTFDIIGNKETKIKIGFVYDHDETPETIWFEALAYSAEDPDGDSFKISFSLPEKYCSRLIFSFDLSDCPIKAVSLDNIVLIPKTKD